MRFNTTSTTSLAVLLPTMALVAQEQAPPMDPDAKKTALLHALQPL